MKYKITMALLLSLLVHMGCLAQAKKPTLMAVPATPWCVANGYVTEVNNQGRSQTLPDYERAVNENIELVNVVTKIGELMADRGFPMKDLSATVAGINNDLVEDEMTTSRTSGASLSETPLERLLNRAKADIIVEVLWKVNSAGPKKSVTYTIRGLDAYSHKQIAAAQGTGPTSFSADTDVLLEEAVVDKMDNFLAQLQNHFDDMVENGREVVLNVRVFDNGSGLTLEDEYDGEELIQVIDDWMAQNTVNHRYSLSDAGPTVMRFEQVRIPMYRSNGMPMDTRYFANTLRKYLGKAPYDIPAKIVTRGLGRADLILGEK